MRPSEDTRSVGVTQKVKSASPRMNLIIKKQAGYYIERDNMVMKEQDLICDLCGNLKDKIKYSYKGNNFCSTCIENLEE